MGSADLPLVDLRGRVIVVTGASSGIGQSLARALVRSGAKVVGCGRRLSASRQNGSVEFMSCDVTVDDERRALMTYVMQAHGRIDGLVNCAGASVSGTALTEEPAEAQSVWDTNVVAVQRLSAGIANLMGSMGGGSIVNISSLSAVRSFRTIPLATYSASKAAVVALSRELAAQFGSSGVRVNAIAPGFFPTPMTRDLSDPEELEWIRNSTALGRAGRLNDLDGPVQFLLSDASEYITGQTIFVDGGWTCF